MRAYVDPNKWCIVIEPTLEASKHDPNSDHCSKKYSEKLLSLKEMLYIDNAMVPYSASLSQENFAITVWCISVQTPYTISRIRLILQGLGLSANLLLGKIVSYTV